MKYVFANWKMYLNAEEAQLLAQSLQNEKVSSNLEISLFPTLLSFMQVQWMVQRAPFSLGVQNVSWVPKGAYTGAVSALIAKEAGAKYALVGHSERRFIFGEKDSDVTKKVQACEEVGLIPVVCIGETAEDVENNKKTYRLQKQIESVFVHHITQHPLVFAYEPLWAISSVDNATPCLPADADDVIGWIKNEIKNYTDQKIPVLYGGSVNAENCVEYIRMPAIDGVLVGLASTNFDSFSKILHQASSLE